MTGENDLPNCSCPLPLDWRKWDADYRTFLTRSQIVAGIRLIERLIAERKVGHDVAGERARERRPVEERRIHDLDAMQPAIVTCRHPVDDSPAPPFDDSPRGGERAGTTERRPHRPAGQTGGRLPDEAGRLLHFLHAHGRTGPDVARRHHRDLEFEPS